MTTTDTNDEIGEFAIIGAGISGLALALGLQREGKKVEIFERDESFESRPQGYSITLQSGAKKALKKLGLFEEASKYPCRAAQYETLTSNGVTINCRPKKMPSKLHRSNIPIPRQLLRKLFYDALLPNTVSWNSFIIDIQTDHHHQSDNDGDNDHSSCHASSSSPITLKLSNGKEKKFRALIGCDGIRSIVREKIVGDQLHYLGVFAVNGITQCPFDSDERYRRYFLNRSIQSINGHCRIFFKPFDSQSIMWQLTIPVHSPFLSSSSAAINVSHYSVPPSSAVSSAVASSAASSVSSSSLSECNNNNNDGVKGDDGDDDDNECGGTEENEENNAEVEMKVVIEELRKSGELNDGDDEYSNMLTEEDLKLLTSTQFVDAEKLLAISAKFLRSFHAPIPEIIQNTMPSNVRGSFYFDRNPINESIDESKKPHPNITIIGDAAHPMSPFKGQGANQALLDSISLIHFLKSNDWNIQKAIREFESEMFLRSNAYVLASRNGVQFLHTHSSLSPENFQSFLLTHILSSPSSSPL